MNLRYSRVALVVALELLQVCFRNPSLAQEPAGSAQQDPAQLKLRKSVQSREYQGRQVEGEERVVTRGDSLWKLLIQEKGLPEKRFGRYVIIVSALNPQLKNPGALPVGEILFIPIHPDELLGIKPAAGTEGVAKTHTVKPGEHLYQILREELGVKDGAEMMRSVKQVIDMNPKKENWDVLFVGETLVLPDRPTPGSRVRDSTLAGPAPARPASPSAWPMLAKKSSEDQTDRQRASRRSLQENMPVLEQILAAVGNEMQRTGVEALPLQEGMVRIDRENYPVIANANGAPKVILDLKGQMPATLKARIEKEDSATRVLSTRSQTSLHEGVNRLLSQLGFQPLPPDRPVVIQDAGVGVIVKGDWILANSAGGSENHELLVISLVETSGETPDYLKNYLAGKGLSLKEIGLLQSTSAPPNSAPAEAPVRPQSETWPVDRPALIDRFYKLHEIPFSVNRQISVRLREGIEMDLKVDRLLDIAGRKTALFFRPVSDEMKRSLESAEGIRSVELDLRALSSRQLIARLLESIGESSSYLEHLFPANPGRVNDPVVLRVSGFFLPWRSLLLTDREIPEALEPFFLEKGYRVVHFR